MAKTIERRTVAGVNIPTTLQLRVKLSPSGRAFWAGDNTSVYRKVWSGTQYVDPTGANHVGNDLAVAWTEDETYQVAVGTVSGVRTLFLRSFNITTGANTLLHSVSPVLDAALPLTNIERITGDYFIAYISNRTLVFTINRTTNQLVVLGDLPTVTPNIRGIAASGTNNIIIVHSGANDATNGFQAYSVNLTTGVLTTIGTKVIPGNGRINGFDFRDGQVLSFSRYGLQYVIYLELDGSNQLVPVPGFSSVALYNNMNNAGKQSTTGVMHLAFDERELTYLSDNAPANFFSADAATLQPSVDFVQPASIPSGNTNAKTYGDGVVTRSYQSYSENGKVFAVTFGVAAATQGVYVFVEDEDATVRFTAQAKKHAAEIQTEEIITKNVYLIAQARKHDAVIEADVNFTMEYVAQARKHRAAMEIDSGRYVDNVAQTKKHFAHLDTPAKRRRIIVSVNRL